MTPIEYLKRCSEIHESSLEDEKKMISEKHLESLIGYSKNNQLPLPFLNYIIKRQEGRHRAGLCLEMNVSHMPVLIIEEDI